MKKQWFSALLALALLLGMACGCAAPGESSFGYSFASLRVNIFS